MHHPTLRTAVTGALTTLALGLAALPAAAQTSPAAARHDSASAGYRTKTATDERTNAEHHVAQALDAVRKMESDSHIKSLLSQSKGVFVVPDYGRASLVVGGQGGAGVLLTHVNGKWAGPAFYNIGGVSIGAQAGVTGGRIAMILMDQKALDSFGKDNKFSLNADAGLTVVDASARGHATAGRGDIVMWSDTAGLAGNLSVSVTDVNYDAGETQAYFGRSIAPNAVVSGDVTSPKARDLLDALPA